MLRLKGGEDLALNELMSRWQTPLVAFILRYVGNQEDALDLAQETFVRAVRSLVRWDRGREFLPWLLAIAANRCRTLLSRRTRRPVTTSLVEPVADEAGLEEPARRMAEELQVALAAVRPEYRQAFLQFHVRQASYNDIAASLGRPVGTIKTWVHRARRELIEQLTRRGALAEVRYALR